MKSCYNEKVSIAMAAVDTLFYISYFFVNEIITVHLQKIYDEVVIDIH